MPRPLTFAAFAAALALTGPAAPGFADEELPLATIGDAAVTGTLRAARVVSAIVPVAAAGASPRVAALVADDLPKFARLDQAVRLYVLVSADVAGARRWFSDAPAVRLEGKLLAVQPLSALPRAGLRW